MEPVWKEDFFIRSYDVDCKNQLRIQNLCSFFQEVAEHHADHLELGFDEMQRLGMVWVLSRLEIIIDRLPEWGDVVTIETWPSGHERLYHRREFIVRDKDGQQLIMASSYWLLINLQSRRPKLQAMPEGIMDQLEGRYAMQVMTHDIPGIESGETRQITVLYGDIDLNRHVNNARYAGWITDMFPVVYHDGHVLAYFRIDIRQEVKPNESVSIQMSGDDQAFILEGRNGNSDSICFKALVKFRNL